MTRKATRTTPRTGLTFSTLGCGTSPPGGHTARIIVDQKLCACMQYMMTFIHLRCRCQASRPSVESRPIDDQCMHLAGPACSFKSSMIRPQSG
jgi:hypothetical protein